MTPRRPIGLTLVCDHIAIGGAEVLLLNLFRHLDPAVVRCRVICLKGLGAMGAEFEAAGFPVEVLGRGGRHDMRTVPRLMRRFRETGTDVVLVHHLHPAPLTLGRIAARLSGRKSVVTPHGMDTVGYSGRRCLPRHDVETLFLSDAIVWLAPSQGSYFHREEGVGKRPWSRTREVVIPNGIPLPPLPSAADRSAARAELGLHDDEFAVGIVARLAKVKAHEVLFDAIAKLAPSHPRLRLVCIGGGEREAELRALADTLGISANVLFTGMRRDVPALLPGLDLACLSSRYECAPLSVIEAMAVGIPVVTADVGAVRDMVTDGDEGYVVGIGDVDGFADRIGRLADDPALRAKLGKQARARAEGQFRIEDTASNFERLLTSLAPAR
ncbi:glycosyltransferase [Pseudonocardia bannensis]|uniref:Glycosyltransferase n=1 Tax=Pseudonocardia bannensis TaxID=630973 RepID=A0A848DES1_9PSEU|nr:glycosyltransferase [Pseudonocardia bannensis]NMH91148.1 glycosyltransferase [Pseudonocardia bannensis]